jgi:mRNA interferase MazF
MVDFPTHVPGGMHEQEHLRPAVVVAVPDDTGPTRFGLVVIAPFTSQHPGKQRWATRNPLVYPSFAAGAGGLRVDSIAMLDQLRAVDVRRVRGHVGRLAPHTYEPVARGLRRLFAL